MTLLKKNCEASLPVPREKSAEELLDFGLIIADKPSGPTSHDTVQLIKEIAGVSRAGHSGTLDPKVTGVLPVGVGGATRLLSYLLKSPKEYVCLMKLHGDVSESVLESCFKSFTGVIDQMVPRKSHVKRRVRKRQVFELELLDFMDGHVLFRALVQAGTYIRKLAHDMGEFLGVGAHMLELRRTRVAHFSEGDCSDLYDLSIAFHKGDVRGVVLPGERLVGHLPRVFVLDSAIESISHGASLKVPGVAMLDDNVTEDCDVAVFDLEGNLLLVGVAQLSSERVMKQEVGVFIIPTRVLT